MLETCNNQASSHVKVPYKTNQIQRGLPRNHQDHPKQPKNAKWWFSKETAVLTHLFHGYGRASMVSGFLTCQGTLWTWWNQSKTKKISKELSGIQNNQKRATKVKRVIFKRDGSLDTFFIGFGRDTMCSAFLTCQARYLLTWWNQSDPMRTT